MYSATGSCDICRDTFYAKPTECKPYSNSTCEIPDTPTADKKCGWCQAGSSLDKDACKSCNLETFHEYCTLCNDK
jgi:hypothetical protein